MDRSNTKRGVLKGKAEPLILLEGEPSGGHVLANESSLTRSVLRQVGNLAGSIPGVRP